MRIERLHWIDEVKILACLLVTIGHFWQSMVAAGILPSSSTYEWFIKTIYFFHVPLFFISSGFLYQRFSKVNSYHSWKLHVRKKLITLGVPYVTFSLITWLLKTVFSESVNTRANGVFYDLIVHPLSPYWYLYALFFIFLIIPTFSEKQKYTIWMTAAILLKIFFETEIYALSIVVENMVWFLMGIGICLYPLDNVLKKMWYVPYLLISGFLVGSVAAWYYSWDSATIQLLLGTAACLGIVIKAQDQNRAFRISRYTMAIYLMHTIFAAGVRSVLIKLGLESAEVHVLLGLMASILGPIAAAEIMRRTKLDFLMEPGKYIFSK